MIYIVPVRPKIRNSLPMFFVKLKMTLTEMMLPSVAPEFWTAVALPRFSGMT